MRRLANILRHIVCHSTIAILALTTGFAKAESNSKLVQIRDVTSISGIRDNQLIGYGLVVGLNGTGDRRQTIFTTQALAAAMQKLGVQISAADTRVNNVAGVIVTAALPPFARPGMTVDVTVASVGDAKSLEGGVLLMTPLQAPDGKIYAQAQGQLVLGGYMAGNAGNSKVVNQPTVGRIPEGAIVERDASISLDGMKTVSLMLRNPDFTAAREMADAINRDFGIKLAMPIDSRRVDVDVAKSGIQSVPSLISRVQNLSISYHPPAKVIVNERTGTIVMGGDVKLSPVAVLHGNLSIEVSTALNVSQPNSFGTGETKTVPQTQVAAKDEPVRTIKMTDGANVEELINGLHAIGATARDIVAILQAIKAAGGLQAELEIL